MKKQNGLVLIAAELFVFIKDAAPIAGLKMKQKGFDSAQCLTKLRNVIVVNGRDRV